MFNRPYYQKTIIRLYSNHGHCRWQSSGPRISGQLFIYSLNEFFNFSSTKLNPCAEQVHFSWIFLIFTTTFTHKITLRQQTLLLSLRACLKKLYSVKQLTSLLSIENPIWLAGYSDTCTELMLFLTITVTVAKGLISPEIKAEIQLKLKVIKNYLRSIMGQKRFSSLSIPKTKLLML